MSSQPDSDRTLPPPKAANMPGTTAVAVEFPCLQCGNALKAKAPKPGRFGIVCKKCGQQLQFTVRAGDPPQVAVEALASNADATFAAPSTANSAASSARVSRSRGHGGDDLEATIPKAPPRPKPPIGATLPAPPSTGDETLDLGSVDGQARRPIAGSGIGASADFSMDSRPVDGSISDYERDRSQFEEDESDDEALPNGFGGYKVTKKLGEGGMGAVYLARQMSLDRPVAVKTMKSNWAKDARFLARFTREAYAAAQLVHHNIVQIYDIGQDGDTPFFSMEFVDGQSFQDILEENQREKRRLSPDEAVSLILQAARGLKLAHDMGMVHRDIKPANLMLNRHGIVKVADLGLVKIKGMDEVGAAETAKVDEPPATELSMDQMKSKLYETEMTLTQAGVAMGTPKYMAPEQAVNAASVDGRADIYSLGCTLYELVTGRPPFDGRSIFEVLSKHAFEPVEPPDSVVKGLPKRLSSLIQRMVAKKPEDRFPSLDALISELEDYLRQGQAQQGPFKPNAEHVETLETAAAEFQNAPMAKTRTWAKLGFFAGCAVAALMLLLTGRFFWALAFLGLAGLTAAIHFVVDGVTQKTYVFSRVRQLAFTSSWTDWLAALFGAFALLSAIWIFGLTPYAIAFGLLAAGAGFAYQFGIARKLDAQRYAALDQTEELLKSFRIKGMDEKAIQTFVRDYSGVRWEEFFEALFGYEAKVAAREGAKLGPGGKPRPKFAAWRDRLIAKLDQIQAKRKADHEREFLLKVEEKRARDEGKDVYEARREAERAASQLVAAAAHVRKEAQLGRKTKVNPVTIFEKGQRERPQIVTEIVYREETWFEWLADQLFGARMRFLIGSLLLSGCLLWMNQNDLIPGRMQVVRAAQQATQEAGGVQEASKVALGFLEWFGKTFKAGAADAKPLELPFIPSAFTGLFDSLNSGAAGLILILSAWFAGIRMTFFAIPAALIAFIGHRFGIPSVDVPSLGRIEPGWVSMAGGAIVLAVGMIFGRSKD